MDWDLDGWLEDRYDSMYERDDAEEFELNQLALDREFDEDYDEDEWDGYDPFDADVDELV